MIPSVIKHRLFLFFMISFLFFSGKGLSPVIYSEPGLPTDQEEVSVFFNATDTPLESFTGDIYAHTGVNLEQAGNWQHVIGNWGDNSSQPQLTRVEGEDDLYRLDITPDIRDFYNVTSSETITGLAFVFRAAEGSPQSEDLFLDVYEAGLSVSIVNPPADQPIVESDEMLYIQAISNESENLSVFIDNDPLATTTETSVFFDLDASLYNPGGYWIIAKADDANTSVYDSTYIFIRDEPQVASLPENTVPGANYHDDGSVTLVLHDPPALKNHVFVTGDFNNWRISEEGYMNKTPDGKHFWLTIENLTNDTEYAYQYFIDNELRLADPYAQKVLDPWNDQYISETTYPNLKEYPQGKAQGMVSVIHPGRQGYEWEATNFTPPAAEDLVIYELLIRDFVETSDIKTVMDSLDYLQNLGVNAIELMPFNEFEGNISWGYNPSFYFATDKAYGTANDYKAFIDECHRRGIAVIMDIVFNHSFNLSPFVQMYFDPDAGDWGKPLPENPWLLTDCPHQPWCWGNTFDQDSEYTHELFNRVTEYWLTEFKVDGFRFDFTKGFTNQQTGGQGWNYDAARINNLKRIHDHVKSVNPDAYVILEHFTDNSEEKELADYGMMIWGNMTHSYQEAGMGWIPDSDFSGMSYKQRGWAQPHLIGYMESHDEERIMFKNLNFGNAANGYNIQEPDIALERAELMAAFYFTIPGPKMIWQFGELGYDFSINHCQNGSIDEGCRVDPKPIRWDYYDDWRRKRVYDVYAMLINLKKEQEVFRTDDYDLSLTSGVKRIHLNHESTNVTVVGNFNVTESTFVPNFQETGTWYEFFSRETLEVTDISSTITLQPGEYRLYSTVQFPDHGVALSGELQNMDINPIPNISPNPSNKGFYFSLDADRPYKIEIFNLNGQLVYKKDNALNPIQNTFFWNSTNMQGNSVGKGMYFYTLSASDKTTSGKIVVK